MKLLIDFGNSCCKWALLENNKLQQVTADRYANEIPLQRVQEIMQKLPLQKINEIHVVSVLGEPFNSDFSAQIANQPGMEIKFYFSQLNSFGVTLSYADPLSYGADRYAAIVAVHHETSGVKIVVDCGTATTVDAIDAQGKFLVGLITPGIGLMCSSLAGKASGISFSHEKNSVQLFNDNTQDAVYSGSVMTLRNGLRGIVEEIVRDIDDQVTVYVTGGESEVIGFSSLSTAQSFGEFSGVEFLKRPNLVLEGLRIMQG